MILHAPLLLTIAAMASDPRDLDRARAEVVRAAVRRVAPSIVTIETIGGAQPLGEQPASTQPGPPGEGRGRSAGFRVADGPTTGLVWSADGWIISSSFNFVRNPTITTVVIPATQPDLQPRRYVAKLVARDSVRRLALLKIDADGLPTPDWAPASDCRPGQYAIACGRGFGSWLPGPAGSPPIPPSFPAINLGIISACARRNGCAVQTDAKTSPANYGGPLLDIEGRVIALLVPLAGAGEELAGIEWYDSGIGFGVTYDAIARVIDRLKAGESLEPGKIGITIVTRGNRCRIAGVAVPSPASDAGIQSGDIITALDGQSVGDHQELLRRLSDRSAGETIRLTILRRQSQATQPEDESPATQAEDETDAARNRETLEFTLMLARRADLGELPPPPAEEPPDRPEENGDREDGQGPGEGPEPRP